MSKNVIFCLDARVEFDAQEAANLKRYKMLEQVIYTSEGARKAAEGSSAAMQKAKGNRLSADSVDEMLFSAAAGIGGGLKAAALGAVSAMKLRITVNSLQRGQHIECKSLDELLGAESAVIEACKNLRVYLDTAATFDGREVLIDFSGEDAQVIATATAPAPMLVAPSKATAASAAKESAAKEHVVYEPEQVWQPMQPYSQSNPMLPVVDEVKRLVQGHPKAAIASAAGVVLLVILWSVWSTGGFKPPSSTAPTYYEAMAPDTEVAAAASSSKTVQDVVNETLGRDTLPRMIRWYAADGRPLDNFHTQDAGMPPCPDPTYDGARDAFICP